jgi:hypothetical protein
MQSPGAWQPDLGLLPEVPCVRCGERVRGLAWGERCRACLAERKRRARRLARRISLAAALLTAVILSWRMPVSETSRIWIGIGTLSSFLLVRTIAFRVAMEFLSD